MKIVKFGGTSLANGTQLARVIAIITADDDRQVVVTSAPGKRFSGDIKVTDLLLRYAQETIANADTTTVRQELKNRYQAIADHFGLTNTTMAQINAQIDGLAQRHYRSFDYLEAAFAAHGERLNAQLIAAILQHQGIAARFVDPAEIGIRVTEDPRAATLLPESYAAIRRFERTPGERLIVPGFFGYTVNGDIATFSRGGSDITGAILANSCQADLYENFTDVSAIYSANPNVVAEPHAITHMSYNEMRELAYAGFAVFHDEAIIPAISAKIRINIKNTNAPQDPGTLIVPSAEITAPAAVTGIAASSRFAALYLHRYLLNREVGFTLSILEILKRHDVSYEHMPSGIDDLTIIFDKTLLTQEQIDGIMRDIQAEIAPDRLEWLPEYAIIMVVGEGLRNRIGALSEIITPLRDAGISLQMINQGASEISIMLGVQPADADRAVTAIYQQLFND